MHPETGYTPVPCPICGSMSQTTLYPDTLGTNMPSFDYAFSPTHNRTFRIVKCTTCTHAFSIVPHKDLWENYQGVVDNEYLKRQDERLMTAANVVEILMKIKPSGNLLDVGCATGDFLSVAADIYQVEGLELSDWSAHIAQERGLTIHKKTLDELEGHGIYDIVTLWGVIEHFERPKKEVNNIARLLRPGGIVGLWTGDIDSWLSKLMGRKWWYIQGQHIQYFSRNSLSRLFADQGFELVQITRYPFTTNFGSLSKSLQRYAFVGGVAKAVFNNHYVKSRHVHLALPGEMCAVFRKLPE